MTEAFDVKKGQEARVRQFLTALDSICNHANVSLVPASPVQDCYMDWVEIVDIETDVVIGKFY